MTTITTLEQAVLKSIKVQGNGFLRSFKIDQT